MCKKEDCSHAPVWLDEVMSYSFVGVGTVVAQAGMPRNSRERDAARLLGFAYDRYVVYRIDNEDGGVDGKGPGSMPYIDNLCICGVVQ